jgi:diguanylate cyclase (GGDEF)-like protein
MIEGERIPHDASKVAPYVTISQGVLTVAPRDAIHPAELVRQADQALYRAKDKGRNAIAVA